MTCPVRFARAAPILAALAALSLSNAARVNPASTFDSGLEGWTGLGGTVSHAAEGYLQQLDTQKTWMSVEAPVAFRGNLSACLGGTLSFDGRNLNGVAASLGSAPGSVASPSPGRADRPRATSPGSVRVDRRRARAGSPAPRR